jgi:hypothetical protein
MLYILHPRHSVIENVDKMIECGNRSFGGAMYGCPKCGKSKFVPFHCTPIGDARGFKRGFMAKMKNVIVSNTSK